VELVAVAAPVVHLLSALIGDFLAQCSNYWRSQKARKYPRI